MPRLWSAAALTVLSALTALPGSDALAQDHDHDHDYRFVVGGRPRIGVMIDARADADSDKIGARIKEVTPAGPADKAGLKAGDIITSFNGTALGGIKSDDEDESGPGQKLIDLAQKLDVGDTVTVQYRRGTETRTARIIAEDVKMSMRMWMPHMQDLPRMKMPDFDGGDGDFRVFINDRFSDLDLVDLNPDLGEYFGSKTGVLVVKAPSDSTIPLKAGDVILKIDGREPKSVSQAERILRSYDSGETAKLEVMRKQKRITVSWAVPERKAREWDWHGPEGRPARVHIERS
jgi:S1-C subfamily serine protease